MKRLKIFAVVMSVVLGLSGLIGCGQTPSDPNTLVIGILENDTEMELLGSLDAAFSAKIKEEENRDITILPKYVSDNNSDYSKSIQTWYKSNQVPDVLYIKDQCVETLAKKGLIENLDPYFTQSNFNYSEYDEEIFEMAKCYDRNDEKHTYFAPRTYDLPVIYLNIDMYKELLGANAEVPVADQTWTWTKLTGILQSLRNAMDAKYGDNSSSYIPMEINLTWEPIYDPFIRSFGGYVFDSTNMSVGFDKQETKNAITKLDSMVRADYMTSTTGTVLYYSGFSVMYVMSRPSFATMGSVYGIDNVAVLPLPIFDSEFTGLTDGTSYYSYGTVGYAVSSKSSNKDLAWKFLDFIMSEEGQEIISSTGLCIPIIKDMQLDPNASWKKVSTADQSAFLFSIDDDYKKTAYERIPATYARTSSKNYTFELEFYTAMNNSVMNAIGSKTVADFCSNAQTTLRNVLGI